MNKKNRYQQLTCITGITLVALLGMASISFALPMKQQFAGQVTGMSAKMASSVDAAPAIQFSFDMDTGVLNQSSTVSNLSVALNDSSMNQTQSLNVRIKDKGKKDTLKITGFLQSDQSKPAKFKVKFVDSTGTAFDSEDFLSGNLNPEAFDVAEWSIKLGKGKALIGNTVPLPLMTSGISDSTDGTTSSLDSALVDLSSGSGDIDVLTPGFDDEVNGWNGGSDDSVGYPPADNGTTSVPEPASMILLGTGLLALFYTKNRSVNV